MILYDIIASSLHDVLHVEPNLTGVMVPGVSNNNRS